MLVLLCMSGLFSNAANELSNNFLKFSSVILLGLFTKFKLSTICVDSSILRLSIVKVKNVTYLKTIEFKLAKYRWNHYRQQLNIKL